MQRVFTKREKIIFYLTVSLFIGSVFFNFVAAPLLKENDDLDKDIAITKTRLARYLRLLSQKDLTQDKYNKISSMFDISLSGDNAAVSILSELEDLAKAANIRLVDVRPQGPSKDVDSKGGLIDLRAEGTIEGYLKFIYSLENPFSILRIKRMQINTKPAQQTLEGIFSIYQLSVSE